MEQVAALQLRGKQGLEETEKEKEQKRWRRRQGQRSDDVEQGIVYVHAVRDETELEEQRCADEDGEEQELEGSENGDGKRSRKGRRRSRKPLYRSLFNYIRSAWSGVNASGNGKYIKI